VHFPVVLLLAGPLLVLLALFMGKRGDGIAVAALVVLLVGCAAAIFAVYTGHTAEHAVKAAALINDTNHPVLHEHEQFAEYARYVFLILTGLFAVLVVVGAIFRKRLKPWVRPAAYTVFLMLCVPACLLLFDAADLGGRLVHKHGVHANIVSADPPVVAARAKAVREAKSLPTNTVKR
jgi:uncharacterized membrane protein